MQFRPWKLLEKSLNIISEKVWEPCKRHPICHPHRPAMRHLLWVFHSKLIAQSSAQLYCSTTWFSGRWLRQHPRSSFRLHDAHVQHDRQRQEQPQTYVLHYSIPRRTLHFGLLCHFPDYCWLNIWTMICVTNWKKCIFCYRLLYGMHLGRLAYLSSLNLLVLLVKWGATHGNPKMGGGHLQTGWLLSAFRIKTSPMVRDWQVFKGTGNFLRISLSFYDSAGPYARNFLVCCIFSLDMTQDYFEKK